MSHVILIICSVVAVYVTFRYVINLSSFAVGLAHGTMAVLILDLLIDKILLKNIDTTEVLKGNPIAYSIYFLAYALIFAQCIANS
jgi:uncharacterized membrane protein YhfC